MTRAKTHSISRNTARLLVLLVAFFGVMTYSVQAIEKAGEQGRVFKGPMAKMSSVKITVLATGKTADTVTDAEGQYQIPGQIDDELIQVRARGRFFDEHSGKLTKVPVVLTAITRHQDGDAAPQVNLVSHLIATRINALAGSGSRGPFAAIVIPMVFPNAVSGVQEALEDALPDLPSGVADDLDPAAEGSLGQAQVIHVSLVVSEAANRRARTIGADPGVGAQSLITDMTRDIFRYGRFSPAIASELRLAERTMDGAAMLRNLVDAHGIGVDLIDSY
ncbi:MAG: hypothetical protein VX764_07390 [Planctomycetota bacterium]|nr:hypothetical protein [Planctomycetota bacterium]